jgi:hypothetical protein
MHDVDRAWVVLGVAQVELLRAHGGLTRNQLSKLAIEGLGAEPWNTYELSMESLIKLANTSLEHSEKLGLTRKENNKYWGSDSCLTADPSEIRKEFIAVFDPQDRVQRGGQDG